jgi:hypothetical protein
VDAVRPELDRLGDESVDGSHRVRAAGALSPIADGVMEDHARDRKETEAVDRGQIRACGRDPCE